jgi:hypothetical protein
MSFEEILQRETRRRREPQASWLNGAVDGSKKRFRVLSDGDDCRWCDCTSVMDSALFTPRLLIWNDSVRFREYLQGVPCGAVNPLIG